LIEAGAGLADAVNGHLLELDRQAGWDAREGGQHVEVIRADAE